MTTQTTKHPTLEEAKAYLPVAEAMGDRESITTNVRDYANLLRSHIQCKEQGEAITV